MYTVPGVRLQTVPCVSDVDHSYLNSEVPTFLSNTLYMSAPGVTSGGWSHNTRMHRSLASSTCRLYRSTSVGVNKHHCIHFMMRECYL